MAWHGLARTQPTCEIIDGLHQNIGGSSHQHTKLIGQKFRATGSVYGQFIERRGLPLNLIKQAAEILKLLVALK